MKTKTTLRLADMPKDYAALVARFMPRPIRDKADYGNTCEIADAFAGFEGRMTADQEDYYDLLCTLIERWDAEHVEWSGVSGRELLAHLLENHGMSGADLSRLLGVSRNLGAAILRGEREITASHARILAKRFALDPGAFI